jgi:hypothetical protein
VGRPAAPRRRDRQRPLRARGAGPGSRPRLRRLGVHRHRRGPRLRALQGSAFIATDEARASERYKAAIVEATAADIVYTNLFTGVLGNYLKSSIINAGLDPDNLPTSDPSKMNFASSSTKAWRDIWGCGQGVGGIDAVTSVAALVDRLVAEYAAARHELASDSIKVAHVGSFADDRNQG